jgi:hypothetical protein
MARQGSGGKIRSSDGGATWSALANLPVGNWFFAYAGGAGVESRWIAVSGTQIKYSDDFGDSWSDRLGNMLSVAPIPAPNMIRVIEA